MKWHMHLYAMLLNQKAIVLKKLVKFKEVVSYIPDSTVYQHENSHMHTSMKIHTEAHNLSL